MATVTVTFEVNTDSKVIARLAVNRIFATLQLPELIKSMDISC